MDEMIQNAPLALPKLAGIFLSHSQSFVTSEKSTFVQAILE
jgi:hypothetical protein